MIRRDIVVTALLTFCLTTLLFMVVPTRSQSFGEYDPWCDINDDGKIDILDVVSITGKYALTGAPTNKTALLLELQSRIATLETDLTSINSTIADLKTRLDLLAYVHNASWSNTQVLVYSQISLEWHSIPDLNCTVTLNRTSFIRISVSAILLEGGPSGNGHWIRALVDSKIAYPGEFRLYSAESKYVTMEFYLTNVSPGLHKIEMQGCSGGTFPNDCIVCINRILIVTACPMP